MSRFELRDSRRLTGPNVIWDKPGPVMDIALEDSDRSKEREVYDRVPSIEKAKKILGCKPSVGLEEGLLKIIDYVKKSVEKDS